MVRFISALFNAKAMDQTASYMKRMYLDTAGSMVAVVVLCWRAEQERGEEEFLLLDTDLKLLRYRE